MKCAMDFTKRSLAEAWTDLGNGPSVWLLPSGGQFYTRSCTRCARLLPHAWSHVPERNGEPNAQDLRCVQCGEHIDSMILHDRRFPIVDKAVRSEHRYSIEVPREELSLVSAAAAQLAAVQ